MKYNKAYGHGEDVIDKVSIYKNGSDNYYMVLMQSGKLHGYDSEDITRWTVFEWVDDKFVMLMFDLRSQPRFVETYKLVSKVPNKMSHVLGNLGFNYELGE